MIPITKPVFDETDFAIIQEPLKSGWVVQGKYVKQFEEMFSQFTGARYSIATTSCTTALHIALTALGLKPGDEVLVPAFTWVSTANCVEYLGAKPVFVDIDLRTFNIDVNQIEEKITPCTKGIIPVHLFGLASDMETIGKIAKRHALFIVEDAACGFDSWYKAKHAGTFGEFGCFSFHPRKAITTGEGGMITTNDALKEQFCRSLRDHGASCSDFQRRDQKYSFLLAEYHHLGYNYRMTDIQGALGVAQMQKSKRIMAGRREAAHRYDKLLEDIEWLQLPYKHNDYVHGCQSYVCLFQPEKVSLKSWEKLHNLRNEIMAHLESKGIVTRQGTHAAALVGYYAKKYSLKPVDFPNAFLAEKLTMTLPLYYGMTEEESEKVVEELKKAFYRHL
jgi:dTDP-4-amino-4,6-dideoxygalactose transaminase